MENLAMRRGLEHLRRLGESTTPQSKRGSRRGSANFGRQQLLHQCSLCGTYRVRSAIGNHIEECHARRATLLLRVSAHQAQPDPVSPPVGEQSRKKTKKHKKEKKFLIWADVLFPRSSQVLAETISKRLRNLGLEVRLIQATRYMSRAGEGSQVVCNFAGPDFVALTERIVNDLSDLISLKSQFQGRKVSGGTAVTLRI